MMPSNELFDWDCSVDSRGSWQDKAGTYPDELSKYVGKLYFHPKTGNLYEVVGIIFQSQDERWEIAYKRVQLNSTILEPIDGPIFTHRPEDFTVEGRFLEVSK